MKAPAFVLAALAAVTFAGSASAANACLSAADRGQDLRAEGKLDEARATFAACAAPACNAVVRADCARWIDEIGRELRAQAAPKPASASDSEDERAPLDPPRSPPLRTETRSSPHRAEAAPFPVVPALLAGASVVALGSFAWFQLEGHSRRDALEAGCGRTRSCTDAELDPVRAQFVASGISLGVSAVALGAAAILYLTRGDSATDRPTVGVAGNGAVITF